MNARGLNLAWSFNNTKLKKLHTVSFGLPAFRSADGFTVCPGAAACANFCFATQGWYHVPRVKRTREVNLALARADLSRFVELAVEDLERLSHAIVRVHDSGDFFSQAYLDAWYGIADHHREKRFYSYTKSLDLDLWRDQPRNFVLVQSEGGKFDARLRDDKPRARIFASVDELLAADYVDGHEDDTAALEERPRIGLVYHGARRLTEPLARVLA